MNTNWFWKYTLLGIIAAALPMSVQAQSKYTVDDGKIVSSIDASYEFGLVIDPAAQTPTVGYWDWNGIADTFGGLTSVPNANGNIYDLGNLGFDVSTTMETDHAKGAVYATDATGQYTFGHVKATHTGTAPAGSAELWGFLGGGIAEFKGSIIADKIEVIGDNTAGDVYGLGFFDWNGTGWGTISGTVDVNQINVSGFSGTGLVVGNTGDGANIDIGNITVENQSWAMGVEFAHHNFGGTNPGQLDKPIFNVDSILVTSATGGAAGIRADGGMAAPASVGTITVTAAETAYGIVAGDDNRQTDADIADLTLKGNIKAESTAGGEAYGVYAKNLTATIANDVTITAANGGLVTTDTAGTLALTVNEGAALNSSVLAANHLSIDGSGTANLEADVQGNLDIGGNGITNFANTTIAGTTTIDGNAIVNFDAETTQLGNGNKLTNGARMAIGDMADGTDLTYLGTWENTNGITGGIFTDITQDNAGYLLAARAEQIHLSDGFLAAFGMHSRNTVWKAVRDQMISGNTRYQVQQQAYYGTGYYGQEAYTQEMIPFESATPYESTIVNPCEPQGYDPCAPMTPAYTTNVSPNAAWATYTGRSDEYRSSYNNRDWTYSMEGVQVGTDLFRSKYTQLGLLFGYESGNGSNDWDRINADDTYLGIYATCVLAGGADIRGVFGYGWQDYDMNRWQDHTDLYRSSFKGNTIEGNLEIGKRLASVSSPWSIRPALGVDVISNEINGAIETGNGSSAVRYGDTKMTQLFVRAGTDLRYKRRGFTLNSGIYYAYDVSGEDLNAGVSSIDGLYAAQLTGSELGRSMLLFNLGGSLQLTRTLALIGGYQGESILSGDNDGIQSTGYVGGSWKW